MGALRAGELLKQKDTNLIGKTPKELDLRDQKAVEEVHEE